MINKLKKILTVASLGVALTLSGMPLVIVSAQAECLDSGGGSIAGCLTSGADRTDPNGATVDANDRVNKTIRLVINVFSLVVGVVSVIMIIVGGLKYITSGGDSGNVTGAKNTILYAIIGLVVVALAQVVVKFVLQKTVQQ